MKKKLAAVFAVSAFIVGGGLAGAGLISAPRSASAASCSNECGGLPRPVFVITQIVADKVPPKTIPPKDETPIENVSFQFTKIGF